MSSERPDNTTSAIYNLLATFGEEGRAVQALACVAIGGQQQQSETNPFAGLAEELLIESGRALTQDGRGELANYLAIGLTTAVERDSDIEARLWRDADFTGRFIADVTSQLCGDLLPHMLEENARGAQLRFRRHGEPAHARKGNGAPSPAAVPVAVRRAELLDRQTHSRQSLTVEFTDFRAGDKINISTVGHPYDKPPIGGVLNGWVKGFKEVETVRGTQWALAMQLDVENGVDARVLGRNPLPPDAEVLVLGTAATGKLTNPNRLVAGEVPLVLCNGQRVHSRYATRRTPSGEQELLLSRVTINTIDMFDTHLNPPLADR